MRLLLPLLLLVIAGGLFFGLTTTLFGEVDALRLAEVSANEDLEKALALKERYDTLNSDVNSISAADQAKLEALLPSSVDTVDLLVKINGIAKGSAMTLSDVKITTEQARSNNSGNNTIAGLGTVTFNFNINGSYGALRQFLFNIEKSLRLVDITSINFNAVEREPYQYAIELKTYWIK